MARFLLVYILGASYLKTPNKEDEMVSYAILFTMVMSLMIKGIESAFTPGHLNTEDSAETAEQEFVKE